MFTAEKLPLDEALLRQEKCRAALAQLAPQATGMLIFARTNIYYLTGTRANGILWLPREGEPVLMVRKGAERCRLESPLTHILPFKSYSHIPELCAQCNTPLHTENSTLVGAEMRALPWSLASMLEARLKESTFVDSSAVLDVARSTKTPYELERMQQSAQAHHKALFEIIPAKLQANMSERDIAHEVWESFYSLGHGGMLRHDRFNEDLFLGHIAAGKNALSPNAFRTPVGSVGEHAAMPYMGYAGSIWKKGQSLILDTGFTFEGYHSNTTVTYFAGKKEDIPQEMEKAYAFCVQVLEHSVQALKAGVSLSTLWNTAQQLAHDAGYAETFMGMGTQHVATLGFSVGLSMEEWPALTNGEIICQKDSVFALTPMIALPDMGMVGIKTLFVITESGAQPLTPYAREIVCISSVE